jgi:hypothetical protein
MNGTLGLLLHDNAVGQRELATPLPWLLYGNTVMSEP